MTLKDVAALAGCSVATVCKVFKNSNEISAETKKTVLQAAKKSGYLQKATTRTAVLGGLKVVLLCDPQNRLDGQISAVSAALQRGGYTAAYTVLEPKAAFSLMLQIGAVGMVCAAENTLTDSRVLTNAEGAPQPTNWLKFLNGLGGVARAARKGQSKAAAAPKPAEHGLAEEKQPPVREEIWLL